MFRRIWRWVKRVFTPQKRKPTGSKPFTPNSARQNRLKKLWDTMSLGVIGSQKLSDIKWYKSKAIKNAVEYKLIQAHMGIPWQVVAVVHGLESSFNFEKNLMNGQPLDQVTTWVPKGYGPWESWEESAIDAFKLKMQQGKLPSEWTLGNTLEFLLLYNGTGYERKGLVSPYLFSYSNHYVNQGGGKYVKDGVFDRDAISLQVGGAVLLKELGFNPDK
jgi:lysozyme family protein